jgi:hypothetical protein
LPDGRTVLGRRLRQLRRELSAHCGGNPGPQQRAFIAEVLRLETILAGFDARRARGEPVDEGLVVSATGLKARLLRRLGPPAASPAPSLMEKLMAERQAREEAAA